MASLSTCLIVKNEAHCLERCLRCVAPFSDEIVVVDTGSTDATPDIARRFTDRVFFLPWPEDFSAARNYAFSLGRCDYLLSVDADEELDPENIQRMLDLKPRLQADLLLLTVHRPEYNVSTMQFRMVRRTQPPYWRGLVHEKLLPRGKIADSGVTLRHHKDGPLDYRRNAALIARLPREALARDFWLCADCWLDLLMSGDAEGARDLFSLLQANPDPYEDKRDMIFLLIQAMRTLGRPRDAGHLISLALWALRQENQARRSGRCPR